MANGTQAGLAGAFGGVGSGAALGAALAAPTGGLSVPIGALIGAGAGGLGGGLFGAFGGRRTQPQINIEQELGRLDAFFNQERSSIAAASQRLAGLQTQQLRSRQVTTGVFGSPVQEAALGRLAEGQQAQLQTSLGQSFSRQAQARSGLLGQLLGIRTRQQAQQTQAEQQRIAGFLGLGAAGLGTLARQPITPKKPALDETQLRSRQVLSGLLAPQTQLTRPQFGTGSPLDTFGQRQQSSTAILAGQFQ